MNMLRENWGSKKALELASNALGNAGLVFARQEVAVERNAQANHNEDQDTNFNSG